MEISIKRFNSFVGVFNKIKKNCSEALLNLDSEWQRVDHSKKYPYDDAYVMTVKNLGFKNVAAAYAYSKTGLSFPTNGLELQPFFKDKDVSGTPGYQFYQLIEYTNSRKRGIVKAIGNEAAELAKQFKSLRFIPKTIPQEVKRPSIIQHPPFEYTEGNHTYRILNCANEYRMFSICRDDEPMYDYLDQGFFVMEYMEEKGRDKERYLMITNELDVHTMHIFLLIQLQPKLTEYLKNKCFVHSTEAQMTRLKLEKKLLPKHKAAYERYRAFIEKDYQSNTSIVIINKIKNGEIEKTAINDCMISKNSAEYENISIESDGLLDILYDNLNFGGEFDIYQIAQVFADGIEADVDSKEVTKEMGTFDFPAIKINGFDVNISLTSSGLRRVNGRRINKNEISQVIYRATCHHSQEEYDLFIHRISRMSLRWHDAITNGLPVKLHSNISHEEYVSDEPSSIAPQVKFWIDPDAKCIKIATADKEHGRCRLGKLIEKIDTINKRTNNRWSSSTQMSRDYRWARVELAQAIADACTFVKKTKKEDGTEESKTTYTITKEEVTKIIEVADDAKRKAIQRSKDFLDSAVKATGAVLVDDFMGKTAYRVKGSLREYAIVIETAKVYDFETKKYRCIVNDNHFRGAGYDDIAARLYVLKNDSVMQKRIGTLQGAPQPQYENTHAYTPERDMVGDALDNLQLD